jgi:hypothetical protein
MEPRARLNFNSDGRKGLSLHLGSMHRRRNTSIVRNLIPAFIFSNDGRLSFGRTVDSYEASKIAPWEHIRPHHAAQDRNVAIIKIL